MMSAIPASSVSLKTMADGTLRISFDIEPAQAQDAFKLFAAPGTQVAIAALKDGYGAKSDTPVSEPEKPARPREPMGDACYKTVMWCQEPEFWRFLNEEYRFDEPVTNTKEAAAAVRYVCAVESRKELDAKPTANERWSRLIRGPYSKWLIARGVTR